MQGAYPLSHTLGVLCLSVLDTVPVDAAARGPAAPDLRRSGIRDLRLIVPINVVFDECEPAVVATFEAALARLEKAGARIERQTWAKPPSVKDPVADPAIPPAGGASALQAGYASGVRAWARNGCGIPQNPLICFLLSCAAGGLVELRGFEPLTSAVRLQRSPI